MTATASELRLELVAKIARPRLLAAQAHYAPLIVRGEQVGVSIWRQVYLDECDLALDEALDAADASILAHSLKPYTLKV